MATLVPERLPTTVCVRCSSGVREFPADERGVDAQSFHKGVLTALYTFFDGGRGDGTRGFGADLKRQCESSCI